MRYYLVEFACFPDSEPRFFLLDEDKYDDWCMCEPLEGYKIFRTIWQGEIEQIVTKQRSSSGENER